ncbi:hypothetical protein PIB30_108342, partial [Stylosanthes scabra]|nr:hypothetical protein [Stylosanthes scabra]
VYPFIILPISFGADRSGCPPTPPLCDSSPDEPRQRDRSPHPKIRASVRRSPRFTAPEYRSFFISQPPPEPTPVIEMSSDDDIEDSTDTKSGLSLDSSSCLYSTSMNLSYNQIRGTIPNWIWGLDNLENLDLSHNFLTNFRGLPFQNLTCDLNTLYP